MSQIRKLLADDDLLKSLARSGCSALRADIWPKRRKFSDPDIIRGFDEDLRRLDTGGDSAVSTATTSTRPSAQCARTRASNEGC